jgi:KaiC/GvpD/RAD55 family RecA-like ATPase
MVVKMERVHTGVKMLDTALAGGIAPGTALLLTGQEGAGATEFALVFARNAVTEGARARVVSALRSPARVLAEYGEIFQDAEVGGGFEVRAIAGDMLRAMPTSPLEGLRRGDVLVVESADALAPSGDGHSLTPCWRELADGAAATGVIVMLLLSRGTLPAAVEAALGEAADVVLEFSWERAGPARRRSLAIVKLRGLAPAMDGDEVPLFEVSLHQGSGFTVDRGRSVL